MITLFIAANHYKLGVVDWFAVSVNKGWGFVWVIVYAAFGNVKIVYLRDLISKHSSMNIFSLFFYNSLATCFRNFKLSIC